MSTASNGNGAPERIPDGTRIGAQLKAARLAARMRQSGVTHLLYDRLRAIGRGEELERLLLAHGLPAAFPPAAATPRHLRTRQ